MHEPWSLQYLDSAVVENFACADECPRYVSRPRNEEEVAEALRFASAHNLSVAIRGGGHSYSCSSTRRGAVMLDLRGFKRISVDVERGFVDVGAGLVWREVLPHLTRRGLVAVHGQCTSVGVAGFALNGGVHFGGLSELFGLASESILALNLVIANGSFVRITEASCFIDGSEVGRCSDLKRALKGAGGSSFGIVTEIRLKVFERPQLQTFLSIISVNIEDSVTAANRVHSFMNELPPGISVTLFGVDKYFKAITFILKFASNPFSAAYSELRKLRRSGKMINGPKVYFIAEFSWLASVTDAESALRSAIHRLDTEAFVSVHALVSGGGQFWSVPSYSLVWGEGHLYGGATVTVPEHNAVTVLAASMERYRLYLAEHPCSDCVFVLHKVGDRIRATNFDEVSVNPSLSKANLWLEIDCGHFHRSRSSWPVCHGWISDTQIAIDSKSGVDSFHYPNVPNLDTVAWEEKYYGMDNYQSLLRAKAAWDSDGVFHHRQSPTLSEKSMLSPLSASPFAQSSDCTRQYRAKLHLMGIRNTLIVGVVTAIAYLMLKLLRFGKV